MSDDKFKEHSLEHIVIETVKLRLNTYLVGPAGSGKTVLAEIAAERNNLPFYAQSVGAQTTMTHLMGYMDAGGRYVESTFRKAYEKGGVFLMDEIDAGNANVFTCINSAISNDFCSFPDKMVARHEDFACVAAANTFGTGGNIVYVGRNQLDAATLDRFVFVRVPYDEKLEDSIVQDKKWLRVVRSIRAAVEELGIQIVVSMRASIHGEKLLNAGFSQEDTLDMVIWRGLDESLIKKILARARDKAREIAAKEGPLSEPSGQKSSGSSESGKEQEGNGGTLSNDLDPKSRGNGGQSIDDALNSLQEGSRGQAGSSDRQPNQGGEELSRDSTKEDGRGDQGESPAAHGERSGGAGESGGGNGNMDGSGQDDGRGSEGSDSGSGPGASGSDSSHGSENGGKSQGSDSGSNKSSASSGSSSGTDPMGRRGGYGNRNGTRLGSSNPMTEKEMQELLDKAAAEGADTGRIDTRIPEPYTPQEGGEVSDFLDDILGEGDNESEGGRSGGNEDTRGGADRHGDSPREKGGGVFRRLLGLGDSSDV